MFKQKERGEQILFNLQNEKQYGQETVRSLRSTIFVNTKHEITSNNTEITVIIKYYNNISVSLWNRKIVCIPRNNKTNINILILFNSLNLNKYIK